MTDTALAEDTYASPGYRALLRRRYESPGWGASGYGWAAVVRKFAVELGASSILDYGCGRGTLKPALSELDVREYDPGIVGKNALPERADLVIATDVLEHVEPELLDNVLRHLRELACRGLFLNIALGPAKEILPDGRNAHLIQQTPTWWSGRLKAAGLHATRAQRVKGFNVWIVL
jgi:hypothetical protein